VSARTAYAQKTPQKVQRELEDLQLVLKARNGSSVAMDQLIRRYTSFVRLKASSYFLAGGDSDDLIQEGLVGLYKAVRDFRPDKETSFRSFAELCVTRQIITAIKTATRFKHAPLNTYVSFSHTPAGQEGDDCTLGVSVRASSALSPRASKRWSNSIWRVTNFGGDQNRTKRWANEDRMIVNGSRRLSERTNAHVSHRGESPHSAYA